MTLCTNRHDAGCQNQCAGKVIPEAAPPSRIQAVGNIKGNNKPYHFTKLASLIRLPGQEIYQFKTQSAQRITTTDSKKQFIIFHPSYDARLHLNPPHQYPMAR